MNEQHWSFPLPGYPQPVGPEVICAGESGVVGVPVNGHPGAFGVRRRHHIHEGIDLYAAEGTPVFAAQAGVVVAVEAFTGPDAGSPWWKNTQAILVEGASGVIVYGELQIIPELVIGKKVEPRDLLGHLSPVLRHDKGRPTTMLHLELHERQTRATVAWNLGEPQPRSLCNPTRFLLMASGNEAPDGPGCRSFSGVERSPAKENK